MPSLTAVLVLICVFFLSSADFRSCKPLSVWKNLPAGAIITLLYLFNIQTFSDSLRLQPCGTCKISLCCLFSCSNHLAMSPELVSLFSNLMLILHHTFKTASPFILPAR